MKRPVAVRRVIPPNRSARRAGICGVALALAAMPAVADDLVPADPWEVIHVAREFGPAEVGRDSLKDPQIVAATEGLNYRIDFYGCRLGRDCDTILFEARFARKAWKEETPPWRLFNRWNSEKMLGRAWRDGENRAVLDWPVTLEGGVPKANLRAAFSRWQTALKEFAAYLDFR